MAAKKAKTQKDTAITAQNNNTELKNNTDIQNMIYTVRNQQIMLDSDLADMYQVETKRLNERVKRNVARFPETFCFQLTKEEYDSCYRINIANEKSIKYYDCYKISDLLK